MSRQVWKSSVYACAVGWSLWLSAALPAPLATRKLRKNTWGSTESVFLVLNLFIPQFLFHWFWIFIHLFPWRWWCLYFICILLYVYLQVVEFFMKVNTCGFQCGAAPTPLLPQLEIYGDICGCHNWWAGCYRLLVGRDHMGCWTSCSTQDRIPTTKNFLV